MKSAVVFFLAGFCLAGAETPMARVVTLIEGLKTKVEADGKAEQATFDSYACWCEKTLERKAADISSSKELIGETEILIEKLKGEIGSHGAEVAQLKKDIAQNLAGQKDASAMRAKENAEYAEEKTDTENCLGGLDAAIKVLAGAGTKKGFLDTSGHEAQLLSVTADVRSVFRSKSMPSSISAKDIDMVKSFVNNPEDWMKAHAVSMSAAQVGQNGPNPFGDYAPQSSQIQGILKSMHDAFTSDLAKDIAAEAEAKKSFDKLSATKKSEQATLESTLEKQETDAATKTKRLKESQVLKDDTTDQLNADEAFFADSKDACQSKASEWSVRTRLRTEELAGMGEAIKILSSDSAKKTFKSATTTFLQLASVNKHHAESAGASKAYGQLKKLATQFKSVHLAKIAAAVQMGGHFDKIMVMIDDMVALLRKEEASDIVHRDLCEMNQNANKNDLDDLANQLAKTEALLKRMGNTKKELQGEISKLETDIKGTEKSMADILKFRNEEEAQFKQALKDDTDGVALLKQAITALGKFYKNNKISLGLAQKPEYAEDKDKAPATWDGEYSGQQSQSGGILAILDMLREDMEKEIAEGRSDNEDAQAKYLKQNGALQSTLDAQEATKVGVEEELAGVEEKIDVAEAYAKGKTDDQSAEGDAKKALATDCAWVASHFETRRTKRKDEMQGLVDAKAFLAGVENGEDPLPPTP